MNQEPGDEADIQDFAKQITVLRFLCFQSRSKRKNAHPLFVYLTEHAKGMLGTKAIKWNFTKFVVDRNGEIVGRYSPNTNPKELEDVIVKLLGQ